MIEHDDPQARARAYLATVCDDPKAKPSDRLRAAEAILRADPATGSGVAGSARAMTDDELLRTAQGEGGRPPERGPASGVTETGPIREGGKPLGNLAGHSPPPLGNLAGGVGNLAGGGGKPLGVGPVPGGLGPPLRDEQPKGIGLLNSISGKGGPKLGPIAPESRPATPISPPKAKRIEKGPKKDEDIDPLS